MSGKSQKINGTKSTKNKHTLTRKITNGQKQSQEVSSSQQITSKNQSVLVAEANRLSVLLKEKKWSYNELLSSFNDFVKLTIEHKDEFAAKDKVSEDVATITATVNMFMNHAASFFRYRDSAKFNYDWCCGVSKIGFGFDFNPGVFHQFLFNMWDDIDRNPQIKTGSKDIGNCLLGYGLVAQTGVKFSIGEELLNDVLTTLSEKSNNQYAAINISNALKGMGLCAIQGVNITIQPKIIQALLSIMVSYPLKLTTLGEAIIGLGHLAKSGMPLQLPPEMIDSLFAIYRKQRAPEQLVLDLQSVIVDANLPEISSENMEYAANQLKQNNNSWFEITKLPTLSLHPESLSTLLDASVEITPVTELESSKINETVAPHKAAESASVTELSEIKPAVNFSESSHSFFSASPAPQMNAPTSIVDESPNTTTVSTQRLNTNAPVFVPGAGRRLFTPVARSPLSDNSEVCVINQNSITITR